ncbi:hypothetical protein B8057_01855 [Klebsiella pneumoniae]|nr:hypothetical protein B8057_01855 [Klebsiella pneumoniae]
MMSLWDALRMNMMISYQELVRTFLSMFVTFCVKFSSQYRCTLSMISSFNDINFCSDISSFTPLSLKFSSITFDN